MRTYKSVISFKDIEKYAIEHFNEFNFEQAPDLKNPPNPVDVINDIISNTIGEETYMKLFKMETLFIDLDFVNKKLNEEITNFSERVWHDFHIIIKSIMTFYNISDIYITACYANSEFYFNLNLCDE